MKQHTVEIKKVEIETGYNKTQDIYFVDAHYADQFGTTVETAESFHNEKDAEEYTKSEDFKMWLHWRGLN